MDLQEEKVFKKKWMSRIFFWQNLFLQFEASNCFTIFATPQLKSMAEGIDQDWGVYYYHKKKNQTTTTTPGPLWIFQ